MAERSLLFDNTAKRPAKTDSNASGVDLDDAVPPRRKQEKRERAFIRAESRHLTCAFEVADGDEKRVTKFVNPFSKSVILTASRVTEEGMIPRKAAENTEFPSTRTPAFRHLGLWPSECDSRPELVIQPRTIKGRRG